MKVGGGPVDSDKQTNFTNSDPEPKHEEDQD